VTPTPDPATDPPAIEDPFAGRGIDLRPATYLYGRAPVPHDDPAECHHEAAKLDPATATAQMGAGFGLLRAPQVVDETARSVRRRGAGPRVALPEGPPLRGSLADALATRATQRDYATRALDLPSTASLLAAAYRAGPGLHARRPVPSGGALYPLELFCVPNAVDGLAPGIWHYDAIAHSLTALDRDPAPVDLGSWTIEPWPATAALVVVVAAAFWRSRFKYGQRAYRFTLLEAGHVGQNLLLAATASGMAAAPVGGFWDRVVDRDLGLDGVDESALYLLAVGWPA
jgi:SagB-type dehydrogenase family enzyme